jgi:hypothetical protein
MVTAPSMDLAARLQATRRWLLAILLVGLIGTAVELVLLEHYEAVWQLVPLLLIALALAGLVWHRASGTTTSRRALQGLMIAFMLAGLAGMVLHFRGAAAFQREINPVIAGWALITKAMTAKAPPVLAAGAMLPLGLLGLTYTLVEAPGQRHD